jgi:hypothetical protein
VKTSGGKDPQRVLLGAMSGTGVRFAVAAALAEALFVGCGERGAPAASALPVAPGARVLASAAGGSQVDTAFDRKQYRYIAIGGAVGESALQLLKAESRFAAGHGWGSEQQLGTRTTQVYTDKIAGVSVKGGYTPVFTAVPTSITTPGVVVTLDSRSQDIYAAMHTVANASDAAQSTNGSPLFGNPTITRALHDRRPVILVTLGNGKATPAEHPAPTRRRSHG